MGSYLVSTTLALVVVCALAVLALRALKAGGLGRARGGLKLAGVLPLDARRSLYLVEAGGRCFLVGAGDGPLTLLAELEPAAIEAERLAAGPEKGALAQAFARMMGGGARTRDAGTVERRAPGSVEARRIALRRAATMHGVARGARAPLRRAGA